MAQMICQCQLVTLIKCHPSSTCWGLRRSLTLTLLYNMQVRQDLIGLYGALKLKSWTLAMDREADLTPLLIRLSTQSERWTSHPTRPDPTRPVQYTALRCVLAIIADVSYLADQYFSQELKNSDYILQCQRNLCVIMTLITSRR